MADPGHELIVGTIGMGKSFWVLWKMIQAMLQDRPFTYIDPKGDTYRNILAFLMSAVGRPIYERLRHRILFINPVTKSDLIIGWNVLSPMEEFAHANPDRVALLANSITSHIRRQSGFELAEAARMQNIMSAAIATLVQGGGGTLSLAELPLLFRAFKPDEKAKEDTFNPFTTRLLQNVSHFGTRSFWYNQWATWNPQARHEWIHSTESRIYQYLFDERVLATICTVDHAKVNWRQVVDQGYFVFVNLPFPFHDESKTTLVGNFIITSILYAAMQRTPGERPYRIILDEARFFNTGPLDMLLETSRAYNLWLTMIVQSLDQMCRTHSGGVDQRLKDTALNNVRYMSVFHNQSDTEVLADIMFPVTGAMVLGRRQSGDYDYLPTVAEQNMYQRRFLNLRKRQVLLYDKFSHQEARVWWTPDVEEFDPPQGQIDMFELEHLNLTGAKFEIIMDEINRRHGRRSPAPYNGQTANFGGVLYD